MADFWALGKQTEERKIRIMKRSACDDVCTLPPVRLRFQSMLADHRQHLAYRRASGGCEAYSSLACRSEILESGGPRQVGEMLGWGSSKVKSRSDLVGGHVQFGGKASLPMI